MTASAPGDGFLAIGAVARAHALRGAVVVKPFVRDLEPLLAAGLEELHLRRGAAPPRAHSIRSIAPFGAGMLLLALEGVGDRTAAEALVGSEILVPREDLWEPAEGEYFIDDLIGLEVVEDAPGARAFGPVLDIREGAGHDHLVFAHPDKPGREALLPFVAEFIRDVDPAARRVLVRIPDGLFEL
ncbi:MAG: ribosome maturation factor RimM [Candidatus Sumerlaeia bacterium]|nr:ribosome maturation factor RimM [Candidatus Sumerlaeia bacterium]